MTFNFGGGLAGGFAQGMQIGQGINELIKEDQVAKVRAQGIAEARAMQAAQTPGVTDQGDMNNLTSRPQASADPAAAPVNTDLAASPVMSPAASGGVATSPVATPEATSTSQLSAAPIASADPNATALPASGGLTVKGGKRFMVGDAGFDDIDSAKKHAASQAPDINDLMRKTLVPKMQAVYLEQGDTARADAWGAWGKSKDGEKKMELWGKAFTAAQRGNFEAAADHLQAMHADLDDGRTFIGRTDVKNDKGELTGFNMQYKDDKTGEEKTQFVDKHALVEMGLQGLSPQKMFEQAYKGQTAADALGAKERAAAADDARGERKEVVKGAIKAKADILERKAKQADAIELEGVKTRNREELARVEAQLEQDGVAPKARAQVASKVALLREAGKTQQEIDALVPAILGLVEHKKTTDPTERRAIVTTELLKNPLFLTKSEAEKRKQVDEAISLIDQGDAARPKPAAAAGVAPQPAKTGGVPVWDPVTNSMIRR